MHFEELDDEIERQEIEDLGLLKVRKPYNVLNRYDNFNMWDDIEFYNRFRVKKYTAVDLLQQIEDRIKHRTDR